MVLAMMFPSRSEYIQCGADRIYAADAADGRALTCPVWLRYWGSGAWQSAQIGPQAAQDGNTAGDCASLFARESRCDATSGVERVLVPRLVEKQAYR
jgi:hypothetical protein